MNNSNIIYSQFQNLFEVISEEDFHELFINLIKNSQSIEEEKLIELLQILEEKFQKFYNIDALTETEKIFITEQLIKSTDFTDLNRICDLTGLMFSFVDKSYCRFLRENLKMSGLPLNVRIEITESVEEFEKTYII